MTNFFNTGLIGCVSKITYEYKESKWLDAALSPFRSFVRDG